MTATSVAAGQSSALVARTREIDRPADLVDELDPDGFAWLEDGTGFVTAGIAARVAAADARAVLARIDVDDPVTRPGTGAVAVGALPFDATATGELVIPARVVGVDTDGRAWCTEIGTPLPGSPWKAASTAPRGGRRYARSSTLSPRERSPRRCSRVRSSSAPTRHSTPGP
jgi:hypothetical protein